MANGGGSVLKWDHWHIEPSSICALQCPRCPRAEVPDSLLNRQLSLSFFQTQIGETVIKQIRRITWCGNDGDPIYCKEFLAICQWIKQVNPLIEFVIITNGSHRTMRWWQNLGTVLTNIDTVHFSLDGYDQTSNSIYRQGSDFENTLDAVRTLKSHSNCYLVWAAIAFRFNQNHLMRMQTMAQDLGMDSFQLTKSTKFGSKYPIAYGVNDELEPTHAGLVASGLRFEREIKPLTARVRPGAEMQLVFQQRAAQLAQYSAICMVGNKGVFVNSSGEFYPCCWVANRYEHNHAWQGRFNLNTRTFDDIINDAFWHTEFLQFDNIECQTKCTPQRLADPAHTTEW